MPCAGRRLWQRGGEAGGARDGLRQDDHGIGLRRGDPPDRRREVRDLVRAHDLVGHDGPANPRHPRHVRSAQVLGVGRVPPSAARIGAQEGQHGVDPPFLKM